MIEKNTNEEISINDFLSRINKLVSIFFKYPKIILFVTLIGVLFGFFLNSYTDPIYNAEVKFLINDQRPTTLNNSFANSLGFDINPINDSKIYQTNTFIQLFKSRKIIEKSLLKTIIYKNKKITFIELFSLFYNYDNKNKFDISGFDFSRKRTSFSREQNNFLSIVYFDIIENFISVERLKENNCLFLAEVKSKNEFFSYNFLNQVLDVITEEYNQMKLNNIHLLENRIKRLKIETNNLLNNNSCNLINRFETNSNYSSFNNNSLSVNLNIKILTELSEQLEILRFNSFNNAQFIQVIDNSFPPLKDEKKSALLSMVLYGFLFGLIFFSILLIFRKFKMELL